MAMCLSTVLRLDPRGVELSRQWPDVRVLLSDRLYLTPVEGSRAMQRHNLVKHVVLGTKHVRISCGLCWLPPHDSFKARCVPIHSTDVMKMQL